MLLVVLGWAVVVVVDVVLVLVVDGGALSQVPAMMLLRRGSQGLPKKSDVQMHPWPEQLDLATPQIPRVHSVFAHRQPISQVP